MFWRSESFGLSRLEAALLGFFSCIDVLLLPFAMQKHWIFEWFILTLILLLIGGFWPIILRYFTIYPRYKGNYQETMKNPLPLNDFPVVSKDETIEVDQIKPSFLIEDVFNPPTIIEEDIQLESMNEEVNPILEEVNPTLTEDKHEFIQETIVQNATPSIEDIIDLGFAAKNAGRFELAAQWFGQALEMGPEPDLAFSLLLDIFWLWQIAKGKEFAIEQLAGHANRINFPNKIKQQFNNWLERENLSTGYFISR